MSDEQEMKWTIQWKLFPANVDGIEGLRWGSELCCSSDPVQLLKTAEHIGLHLKEHVRALINIDALAEHVKRAADVDVQVAEPDKRKIRAELIRRLLIDGYGDDQWSQETVGRVMNGLFKGE